MSQFYLQINFYTSKSKWLLFIVTLQCQLWFHHLEYLSILFYISVTTLLICQILHNIQDRFIKETNHLQDLHLILSNLAKQFHLFLAQVSSLQIIILIGRMLLLLILLLIWHLINLLFLLTYSQNFIRTIILMSSWLTYLVNLQKFLILIRPLVLTLIQEELKPISLTLLTALSLTSLIIYYSNVVFIFIPISCNLTWILQKLTLQWPISLE